MTHKNFKKIIDGKVYNTATSALIHTADLAVQNTIFDPDENPHCQQLYRTRLGKFFVVERNESYFNLANNELDLRDNIFPMTSVDAIKWMEDKCNEKIEQFVEVDEAGDPDTTLTLRISKGHKIVLNAIAMKKGVSLNGLCALALKDVIDKNSV
jgi:hypothetical protein